ncbi:MAG: phenylalanine--tRNA ligase subunit alpha [Candidatus Omnitrophica bacterium]|nr:phenylalanine--tRNA ligase subunit alpha [Candidatus Omnitrophota bacterium]
MNTATALVEQEADIALRGIRSLDDLERLRIYFLGKNGKVTLLMGHLKTLAPEDRKLFGQQINRVKVFIESGISDLKEKLLSTDTPREFFDETLPPIAPRAGALHPITQTLREICQIFTKMGFEIVDGPEIETEFHNFTALNIPLDHPSRESFDTFYTPSKHLLRSQTSTVQIRVMEETKPPIRIIAPGRVYRPDTVDASHSFMFHQIEGLLVDQKVTFSNLKGVLNLFLRELFGSKTKTRFRPHFFPFTEPSVEVDIAWGSRSGWLEILGAGSVDPNVFKAVGYPAGKWQGFAFGLGVERIAMLRHGITDIRHFYENDLRFLRQFS